MRWERDPGDDEKFFTTDAVRNFGFVLFIR